MSKKSKIHFRESDLSTLQRAVNNFNAKIYRERKKHPENNEYLPDRQNAKQLIESVQTRADFNILINSLKGFTKRGAEQLTTDDYGRTTTKWENKENKKTFNRTIDRFNKKLDQVAIPDNIDYLPMKIDKKVAREEIENYEHFQHFIDRHSSFLKEGAEEIVKSNRGGKFTKWEVEEFYKNQDKFNEEARKRAEELKKKPVTIAGKDTGQTRATMGSIEENEVRESHKNPYNMTQEEFRRATRLMEKRMKPSYTQEQAKNKLVHYCVGLEHQGLGDLVDIMKKVPLDVFLEKLDTDEIADFDFIYDPQELAVRREKLLELWQPLATNEKDHSIEYWKYEGNNEKILIRL